jgi:hypothetical protein
MEHSIIPINNIMKNTLTSTNLILLFLILLGYALNTSYAIKIPSTWLSNLSSFAGGGVGGEYCKILCTINEVHTDHPHFVVGFQKRLLSTQESALSSWDIHLI